MTKFENSWSIIREKVWLEISLSQLETDPPPPRHPPSDWLRLFLSQTFSRMILQLFSNLVIIHLFAYEYGVDRVFRNVGI